MGEGRVKTAYLCVKMRAAFPVPVVTGADIYSSPPSQLTSALRVDVYAEIMRAEAPTYNEARKQLIKTVFAMESLKWARVWVDDSARSHEIRGYMKGFVVPKCPFLLDTNYGGECR